ncbi:MAG: hypothetical protein PWQ16_157 [bacterium]|nr:hypothetical protein [bacterium]
MVKFSEVKEGDILGRSIYTPDGYPLLRRGVYLERKHIEGLAKFNLPFLVLFDDEEEKEVYEKSTGLVTSPFLKEIREIYLNFRRNIKSYIQPLDGEGEESVLKRVDKALQSKKLGMTFLVERGKRVTLAILGEILRGDRKLLSLGSFNYEDGGMLWEHWLNVSVLSMFTAFSLGYKTRNIWEIGVAALFHDIGKLFLDLEEFFFDPFRGRDDVDFKAVMHTILGYGLLRSLRNLSIGVSHVAYQHHERFDGTGYPRGLERGEISGGARIVALCNYFDALLSGRLGFLPSTEKACLRVENLSDSYFDPKVVDVFISGVVRREMLH